MRLGRLARRVPRHRPPNGGPVAGVGPGIDRVRASRSAASRPAWRRTPPGRRPPSRAESPGGTPRCASRTPFSAAAPRITGRAIWREITFASARRKRSTVRRSTWHRCATRPRGQREGLRDADRERVERSRPCSRSRFFGRAAQRGRHRPADPASRAAATGQDAQAPLDRALEQIADGAGGANDSASRRVGGQRAGYSPTPARSAISRASGRPACSATSKALRSSGSSSA